MQDNPQEQEVPVKVYRSNDRLTVAAPMPGMEPQNIQISLSEEGQLTLDGDLRGLFKGDKDVIRNEWNPGHYHRSLDLDTKVDGTTALASYENGVLVVSMPVSDSFRPARITLECLSATEGRHMGSGGDGSR